MADKTVEKKDDGIEKMLAQGEQLLNRLDFKGAVSRFNKAIKARPDDPRGYLDKAEASIGIPRFTIRDISELYEKAIELDGKNPLYYVRYGGFCLDNGLFRRAEECYREAAKIDPENAYLYYSEFAIEFYYSTKRLLELKDEHKKKVAIISIYYLLRALNISKKMASGLLQSLDPVHPPFEILKELEKKEIGERSG